MLRSVLSECCGLTLMKLLVVALFEKMLIMTPVSPSVSSYCSCVFPGVYNVNAGFVPAHFCLQLGFGFLPKRGEGLRFVTVWNWEVRKFPSLQQGNKWTLEVHICLCRMFIQSISKWSQFLFEKKNDLAHFFPLKMSIYGYLIMTGCHLLPKTVQKSHLFTCR